MSSLLRFRLSTCVLLYSFLMCPHSHGVSSCSPADRSALASFSGSLGNASADCCRWRGVRCGRPGASGKPRVVSLDLAGRGLTGGVPSTIARMDKLRSLNLSWNSLQGPIPPELLRMPSLRLVDLSHNGLTGELGGDGAGVSRTTTSRIAHLNVSFNSLSGLRDGVFLGLPRLRSFSAESNLLAGAVPSSLSSCSELEHLNMANNSLNGTLADVGFARLLRLRAVDLGWNRLRSRIPASISRCRDLRVLNLRRNDLSGEVPPAFRRLQALSFLNIGNNSITGIAQALRVLQECRALAVLILTMNFQGEELPGGGGGGDAREIRGFPRMQLLGIANCALRGAVPEWLRASTRLRTLDLGWNQLAGRIPPWLGGFDELFRIDLSGNALTGGIPPALARLKSLAAGGVSSSSSVQQLDLPDYGVQFYNWHKERGELWYGRYIPPSLDLSGNGLAGAIPPELGGLRALAILNLSCNSLSGPIPAALAALSALQVLDLSVNELTGEIPAALAELTFLSSFDVSRNHLRGVIPNRSQFSTFPCSSFAGNPGLHGEYCGDDDGADDGAVAGPWAYGPVLADGNDLFGLPFGLGMAAGLSATILVTVLHYVISNEIN